MRMQGHEKIFRNHPHLRNINQSAVNEEKEKEKN
jgi:hypothetical protein